MKQKLKGTIEFKVNEEKRSVVCVVIAHGKRFFGHRLSGLCSPPHGTPRR